MSLIARQSIKYSILSYVGVAISTLASIFLYPNDFAFLGDIRFLMSSATALFPFIIMGTSASMVKFYPQFESQNNQLNLLYFGVFSLLLNAFVLIMIYWIWNHSFPIPYFINDIWANFPTIIFISLLLGLVQLGSRYISNFGRISIPVIFESLMPKIGLIISFSAFVFWGVQRISSIHLFIIILGISVVLLGIYLSRFQSLQLKNPFSLFKNKKFTKEFYAFGSFSLLGGIGSIFVTQIDLVMIREMIDDFSTGTYATLLSIIGLMYIPYYAINTMSGPIISNDIYEEKWNELKNFYQSISRNLFFIGSALWCIILAGAPSLFTLMKNGEVLQAIFPVLYFLGAASLFDLGTGFNSQIISYSKFYRFNLYVTLVLAVFTISLNYIFIKHYEWGVIGVAAASCISLLIYNICKLLFIGKKFNIYPYFKRNLAIIWVLIMGLLLGYFLPETSNAWLSLFYKPIVVGLLFFIANQFLKILPLHQLLTKDWKKALMG